MANEIMYNGTLSVKSEAFNLPVFLIRETQSQPPMNETNISMSFYSFKGEVFLMCFSFFKKTEH